MVEHDGAVALLRVHKAQWRGDQAWEESKHAVQNDRMKQQSN
jgi:hypothetical protein